MTRYLCCLAVFGVAAVPDWASACRPVWAPPPCAPVPAYPQFYLIPHPVPVYEVPLPPPVVQRVPAAATRPPVVATPTPAPAPAPEPVRPAANVTPMAPVVPPKAPEVKAPPAPLAPPKVPPSDVPPLVLPDEPKAAPKTSPLVLPDPPAPKAAPKASPLVLPEVTEPKGTPLVVPVPAVPSPAPAPDADPKRSPESIPPLVLPPDLPTGPSGVIPPTTARSSPLAALPRVEVFPAAGAAAGARRKVGFFNHTDRDLRLVIEGRPVLLPAKNYLHAELSPVFRWSEAGGPERRTTVPADAAGVDVLFRGE